LISAAWPTAAKIRADVRVRAAVLTKLLRDILFINLLSLAVQRRGIYKAAY
jgi:hypothetical protein